MNRWNRGLSVALALKTLALAVLLVATACGPSESGSCAICGDPRDTAQCDAIAKANGCEKGEAVNSTACPENGPWGCKYFGCTTVVPSCDLPAPA